MTKIQNSKPVWVIGYCHLEFICILVLVFWYLALSYTGGHTLKPKPALSVYSFVYPGLKYRAAGDNG
jgi:hypothetical protein